MSAAFRALACALVVASTACGAGFADEPQPFIVEPHYVQNVRYDTVIVAAAAVASARAAEPSSCELVFRTSTRCAFALTTDWDTDARERFVAALEPARRRVAEARASGDPLRIQVAEDTCAAALSAYGAAPCNHAPDP